MRIAMMTNNYKPVVGGVPISIERLAAELRRRGNDVTIFAPHYENETPEPGVARYRSLDRRLPGGVVIPDMLDPAIEEAFRERQFDVIHVHHPMMIGYSAMYLGKKYGVPMALTYHTRYEQYLHHVGLYARLQKHQGPGEAACDTISRAVTAHNRMFTNRCDLVFAPTPMIRDYLREHGTVSPVVVLPTGLAEEDFTWDKALSEELRERYLEGREHLFCSVSRLEKEKNIPFLLRALKRYREKHGDSFRMLFLGDGTQKEALEAEAKALGIGGNVRFLGTIPHEKLSSYYRACDLFLFASKSETQGIVLLEAMAAGLPVVAVEASGVCDVVEDGCNGFQTAEDEEEFAGKAAMATGASLWRRMSIAAGETAAGCTAANMAAAAESQYESLLWERRWQDDSAKTWKRKAMVQKAYR